MIGSFLLLMSCTLASYAQTSVAPATPVNFLPDPVNAPVVFISSSCAVCKLGEPMTIGFAADQDGEVTVLLITPDGQQSTLLNQSVKANALEYVSAVSTAPIGKHALIALFGAEPGDLAKNVAQLLPDKEDADAEPVGDEKGDDVGAEQKGLALLPQPANLIPHAIREFEIIE